MKPYIITALLKPTSLFLAIPLASIVYSLSDILDESKALPKSLPGPPNVTRYYEWSISRGIISPDGVEKPALLVNNVFPGPLLEANYGDTFHITVTNNIESPQEGTLLHWHGLLQNGTPWYDGVPGIDVCPIAPGRSLVYEFKADSIGTTWWHSHYSAQLTGGLMGPLVIHGSTQYDYDIDLGPILLSDNYHQGYEYYIDRVNSLEFEPVFSDNNLINGRMYYNCSLATAGQNCTPDAPISKFGFKKGKNHLLRLVNAGSDGIQCFSIDGHNMTIVAVDFTEVEPYQVDVVTLGVGQRAHVLVEGTGETNGSYWMRSNISAFGSLVPVPPQPFALAAVYYEEACTDSLPTTVASSSSENNCGVAPIEEIHPALSLTPPASPSVTQVVNISLYTNSTGYNLFHMNDVSFRVNYDHPVLLLANLGNVSYPNDPQWNVYNFGSSESPSYSIRIIFLNTTPLVHPMHLHGHQYWVEAVGTGQWNGTVTNPTNPVRRDVQLIPAGTDDTPGYLVVHWLANNPGVWPFHCHIAWHSSTGLYISVLEQPDKLTSLDVPHSMVETCRGWWAFTNHTIVDQIDSGL